jgi:hypothetical protein
MSRDEADFSRCETKYGQPTNAGSKASRSDCAEPGRSKKDSDIRTIIFGSFIFLICGIFNTYQLARAAFFGVILGRATRGESLHDVFRAPKPDSTRSL